MGTDNRMRKHYFSMRLHEYEDALLEAKKDEANMTKSDYLRNVRLFAPAGERARYSSDFAVEICQRLNEIGNRINEIAHAVNGRREVVTMDIEMLIVEYTELLAVYDAFVREKVDNPY